METSKIVLCLLAIVNVIDAIINGRYVKRYNLEGFPVLVTRHSVNVCSGSLVTMTHVLTAGRCICLKRVPSEYSVLSGTTMTITGGKITAAKTLICHKNFTMPSANATDRLPRYDLGIIVLEEELQATTRTNPIALPLKKHLPNTKTVCYIPGWGETDCFGAPHHYHKQFSTLLHFLDDMYTDQKVCRSELPPGTVLDENQICIMHDSCLTPPRGVSYGDIGAPLICNNHIIGVLSNFTHCGSGLPEIFTSVYHLQDFIREHIPQDLLKVANRYVRAPTSLR